MGLYQSPRGAGGMEVALWLDCISVDILALVLFCGFCEMPTWELRIIFDNYM